LQTAVDAGRRPLLSPKPNDSIIQAVPAITTWEGVCLNAWLRPAGISDPGYNY